MWSLSKPIGTILVLLAIFLFSLPAQAKYSGGSGTAADPYQIATAADLIGLGEDPNDYNKHFILTRDIDLEPNLPSGMVFDKAVVAPDTDPNDTFSQFQGRSFTGVFDGNSCTISHLTITGGSYVGLFGQLASGAEVMDIGVVDVNVTGSGDSIGGLVGSSASGIISDCYSTGVVSGTYNVGGLVGENYWGQATHCYSTAQVSGTGNIGGLIGYSRGTVSYCRSTGAVDGGGRLGGLIGYNRGNLSCCYSTAVISGSQGVGGLVGGHYDGSVSNSYSAGSVWGNDYVGGLVGHNQSAVTSSYSNGEVSGQKLVGGLVGWNRGGTVTRCFWDRQTAGQTMSAGGTGLITAEMQMESTFVDAGWDFVGEMENGTQNIWAICEGLDYPKLAWQFVIADYNSDGHTDFMDFCIFGQRWFGTDSSFWCPGGGTDLTNDAFVDFEDLMELADNWLTDISHRGER